MDTSGDAQFPEPEPKLQVRGHAVENWNRSLILLKFALREQQESRVGKKDGQKARATSAAKDAAQQPVFLTDEDFATMIEGDAVHVAADEEANRFYLAREELEAVFEKSDTESETDSDDGIDLDNLGSLKEHMNSMEKVFGIKLHAGVNATDSRKVRS